MKITLYQIDAFADRVFTGNPAAVCILDEWINDDLMQSIAAENNLAETAFAVKNDPFYEIRWFTPTVEVDLCGHATLATAYVLFEHFDVATPIKFHSGRSGPLQVARKEEVLTLDFPSDTYEVIEPPTELLLAMGDSPVRSFKGKTDYMLIYPTEQDIVNLAPDYGLLSKFDVRGVIATAAGNQVDFVSRWFGPNTGVDEDPVTGSAHTTLTPYWARRLDKTKLSARQLSKRGGELQCEYLGDRVKISGRAKQYLVGEIEL